MNTCLDEAFSSRAMHRIFPGHEGPSAMDEEKKSVSWRWILGALIAYPVIGYIAFWMLFGNRIERRDESR